MPTRSVILIATNKNEYLDFAFNCISSIHIHNPEMPIYLVTNIKPKRNLGEHIYLIEPDEKLAKLGIGIKLYLDTFLQTDESLFIDSDCLCYDDLNLIFNAAAGNDVSVAGNIVVANTWCNNNAAKNIKEHYNIDKLIRFNGGLYYLKRSELTNTIFYNAREIATRYDEYGLERIKNKWINEEWPLSIAMLLYSQKPFADNGDFFTDFFTDRRPSKLNVLRGERRLKNPALNSLLHRLWYPAKYSPVLLHFGGSNINSYPYISQKWLLKLFNKGYSRSISTIVVILFIHLPFKSWHWLNSFFKKLTY